MIIIINISNNSSGTNRSGWITKNGWGRDLGEETNSDARLPRVKLKVDELVGEGVKIQVNQDHSDVEVNTIDSNAVVVLKAIVNVNGKEIVKSDV